MTETETNRPNPFGLNLSEWITVFILILLLVYSVLIMFIYDVMQETYRAVNSFIYIISLLFTMILYVVCAISHDDNLRQKRWFRAMILLTFFSSFFSNAVNLLDGVKPFLALSLQIVSYILLAVYWFAFWMYQKDSYPRYRNERIIELFVWIYFGLYVLLSLGNFFFKIFFYIGEDGYLAYCDNNLFVYFFYIWYAFYLIHVFMRKCKQRIKWSLASYVLFPLLMLVLSLIFSDNLIFVGLYDPLSTFCILLSLYIIFFNMHTERGRQLLEKEQALNNARIHLMLSQIQPHFIYNSLTAIIGLIDIDKDLAKETIVSFSDYLRVNLDSLTEVKRIPFSKELEHCRTYLTFEQLRFDNIRVEYEIAVTDFLIPPLTVQPLVENAVKHGVSALEKGGTVTLRTEEKENCIRITVIDDGLGFDPKKAEENARVGILNVRKRLADMCGGTLTVESVEGVGTKATILIPKDYHPEE